MRVLRVTSPLMRGPDVLAAQRRLIGRGFLGQGQADGIFGELTASASADAKWVIGYAPKACTPIYGKQLDDLLSGKRKPTAAMRVRANRRAKQQPKLGVGVRAADTMTEWARAGWRENPARSNFVPQLSALGKRLGVAPYYYNMRYPYCAYGAFIAALQHGSHSAKEGFAGRFNVLYCPSISVASGAAQFGMHRVAMSQIKKGTYVLFDWRGNGVMDHIGIALGRPGEAVTAANKRWTPSAREVVCVEGNTSVGNDSNGGQVMIRIRSLSSIRNPFEIT
jgi:hypothetical protein